MSPRRWIPSASFGLALLTACGGGGGVGWRPADRAGSVLAQDLNKDGRLDLAFALSSGTAAPPRPGFVSRRYQDPAKSGSYQDPIRQDANHDPVALAAGDLDGDGLPDLVVANTQAVSGPLQEGTLSLLLTGPQILVVLPPRTLSLGLRNPVDLALADVNGDGRLDILVAARGARSLLILFQSGSPGSFAPATAFPLSAEPTCVAAEDLNGDGRIDVAVGLDSGALALLLQDPLGMAGPGLFRPPVDLPVGRGLRQIRSADLGGRGRRDLAVALDSGYGGELALLFQDPVQAGRFLPAAFHSTLDDGACALAIADLDGDGAPEVVVANVGPPGYPGSLTIFHRLWTFRDDGTPAGFGAVAQYAGYWGPTSVAVGDVDGDGRPDLLIADGEPMVRTQDPTRPGTFFPPLLLRY